MRKKSALFYSILSAIALLLLIQETIFNATDRILIQLTNDRTGILYFKLSTILLSIGFSVVAFVKMEKRILFNFKSVLSVLLASLIWICIVVVLLRTAF